MKPNITNFQEACNYLQSFVRKVDYTRDTGINNPLERMNFFLNLLGNPQKQFPSIVVSGTSGKGSTTHMINSILNNAGYKTGMTISPHLTSVRERFQIQNTQISEAKFVKILNDILPFISQLQESKYGNPSYFEIILGMVFTYFALEKVDIAVVEVGLEGKFDGTNVLKPLIFVLTNISLDHTQILGNSIEEIADEATERVKDSKMVVVTGIKQIKASNILLKKSNKAKVLQKDRDFRFEIKENRISNIIFNFKGLRTINNIHLSLSGEYQVDNASLAIETVLQLGSFGLLISDKSIKNALSQIRIPGRFEIIHGINTKPFKGINLDLILDGAHNPAKMACFINSLQKYYKNYRYIFILSFSKGHQWVKMLKTIEKLADFIVVTEYSQITDMGINRTVKQLSIVNRVLKNPKKKTGIVMAKNPVDALERALDIVKKESQTWEKFKTLIIATGSMYLVGSLMESLQTEHL